MKITVYGATGMIGQRIVNEALARGHEVIAVARHPENLKLEHAKLKKQPGDIANPDSVAYLAKDSDAIVCSVNAPEGVDPSWFSTVAKSLLEGTSKAGKTPMYVVGGAGSLHIAPNVQLVDTPNFPEAYKSVALEHRKFLEILKNSGATHWTYLSPAAFISPGERTGKFRLGLEELVTDSEGNSKISAEDFAVALLDEIESPKHQGKRFTLAY